MSTWNTVVISNPGNIDSTAVAEILDAEDVRDWRQPIPATAWNKEVSGDPEGSIELSWETKYPDRDAYPYLLELSEKHPEAIFDYTEVWDDDDGGRQRRTIQNGELLDIKETAMVPPSIYTLSLEGEEVLANGNAEELRDFLAKAVEILNKIEVI